MAISCGGNAPQRKQWWQIDLPTLLWRRHMREVNSMKGSRHLIKASALFVETWIILVERTDLGGSETESSGGLDSWSRESAADINTPCVALQLAALKIHLLLTKVHIYQTACGHFMRPPHGISNVYKHGWSQWELHLTTECRLVN